MTPHGSGSRLSVLSDPRNDATSNAGAATPSMLRRWPSKSNGVRRSAGVRMEGPNSTPAAPVSASIGLGGGRIGPGSRTNGCGIRFIPGVVPGRPPSGAKSDGRATAGCTVGHLARRLRSSGGLLGARRFHHYPGCPGLVRTTLPRPPRHSSVGWPPQRVGSHHGWGRSLTRLG